MIRYALACEDCTHQFEAWFASSDAFDRLIAAGEAECPSCGGEGITKQIMAPAIRTARAREASPPDPEHMAREFARRARAHVRENFDYVGDDFANEARAMYYGDSEERPIWGEATPEESEALAEEGVPALPLPPPFAPKPPRRKRLSH
jgi:hypothetical protein